MAARRASGAMKPMKVKKVSAKTQSTVKPSNQNLGGSQTTAGQNAVSIRNSSMRAKRVVKPTSPKIVKQRKAR